MISPNRHSDHSSNNPRRVPMFPYRPVPPHLRPQEKVSWIRMRNDAEREYLRRRSVEAENRALRVSSDFFRMSLESETRQLERKLELEAMRRDGLSRKVRDLESRNRSLQHKLDTLVRWRDSIAVMLLPNRRHPIRSLMARRPDAASLEAFEIETELAIQSIEDAEREEAERATRQAAEEDEEADRAAWSAAVNGEQDIGDEESDEKEDEAGASVLAASFESDPAIRRGSSSTLAVPPEFENILADRRESSLDDGSSSDAMDASPSLLLADV